MTFNKARATPQKPTTIGSQFRAKLDAINDNTGRMASQSLPTDELLRRLRMERRLVNEAIDLGILLSRQKGYTWDRIGRVLEISAQALEQRLRRLRVALLDDPAATTL